jgi:hypothetical protein
MRAYLTPVQSTVKAERAVSRFFRASLLGKDGRRRDRVSTESIK